MNLPQIQTQVNYLLNKMDVLERQMGVIPSAPSPFERKKHALSESRGKNYIKSPVFGLHLGVCVDTRDPWKMGRIQVYCPTVDTLSEDVVMAENELPWATPCSAFGAIDNTGSIFIPPEGSIVVCAFQYGSRESMFYLGTTWVPKKYTSENFTYAFNPDRETRRFSKQERNNDTLTGITDSLFPPWNNESYYGKDLQPTMSETNNELTIKAQETKNFRLVGNAEEEKTGENSPYNTSGWRSRDIPHIYGLKSPEKHFLQFVDGSTEVPGDEDKYLGKRLVLQSSKGSLLFFKDDCERTSEEIFKHKYYDTYNDKVSSPGSDNAFSKTLNRHSIELNHTGVQIQSFGGGRIIIDDKIKGDLKQFQNRFFQTFPPKPKQGKVLLRTLIRLESHTEHRITLSDHNEEDLGIRSPKDGIFLSTACGHFMSMVDHTDKSKLAGKERKIHIKSTSGNEIIMSDYKCSQSSRLVRASGRYTGEDQRQYRDDNVYDSPAYKSDGRGMDEEICIKIKSAFGQFLLFSDLDRQDEPRFQYILLSNAPMQGERHNFFKMYQISNSKLVHLFCAGERLTEVALNYTRRTSISEYINTGQLQSHTAYYQWDYTVQSMEHLAEYGRFSACSRWNTYLGFGYMQADIYSKGVIRLIGDWDIFDEDEGDDPWNHPAGPVCVFVPGGPPLTGVPSRWVYAAI